MTKYTFIDKKLIYTPYCHATGIKSVGASFDIAVRLIILDKLKAVYIRINDLTIYQGLEFKKIDYTFNQNLKACEAYLKKNYKKYKVYTSYTISKLPLQIQRDILNS